MSEELYAFRYKDPVIGRWRKARHQATREDIARSNEEWKIVGEPEIRVSVGQYFNPYRTTPSAELKRRSEPPPVLNPHLRSPPEIDHFEQFLMLLFLRRYVRYCLRRRQFAAMEGAAVLHRELSVLSVPP